MSKFTEFDVESDLVFDHTVTDLHGREHWRVLKPFSFYYGQNDDAVIRVVVPAGFHFTGKTIPTEFWGIASPLGQYPQLAALHEYLLESREAFVKGISIRVNGEMINRIMRRAIHLLAIGAVGHRMLDTIIVNEEISRQRVKNNPDHKSYGNETLALLRGLLMKEGGVKTC
jgi:hypothetical protein